VTPSTIQLILAASFSGLVVSAAVFDFRTYTIPNWISAALVALFAAAAMSVPLPVPIVHHVLTALAVLAIAFVLYCGRLMGGGDVKLWAAVALWLGPDLIVSHVVIVGILGGLLGAVLLAHRTITGTPRTTALRSAVPYGIPIAAGALWLASRISAFES
jgi:prepilin peptidase CpaA